MTPLLQFFRLGLRTISAIETFALMSSHMKMKSAYTRRHMTRIGLYRYQALLWMRNFEPNAEDTAAMMIPRMTSLGFTDHTRSSQKQKQRIKVESHALNFFIRIHSSFTGRFSGRLRCRQNPLSRRPDDFLFCRQNPPGQVIRLQSCLHRDPSFPASA